MESRYLSIPKAAAIVGYSDFKVRQLIASGRLKVYRIDHRSHPRIKLSELQGLLQEVREPARDADIETIMAHLDVEFGLNSQARRRRLH